MCQTIPELLPEIVETVLRKMNAPGDFRSQNCIFSEIFIFEWNLSLITNPATLPFLLLISQLWFCIWSKHHQTLGRELVYKFIAFYNFRNIQFSSLSACYAMCVFSLYFLLNNYAENENLSNLYWLSSLNNKCNLFNIH